MCMGGVGWGGVGWGGVGAGEVLLKFAPCSVLTRIACPHHPRWQSTRGGAPRTSLGTSNQCTHPAHKPTKWHAHPWPPGHIAWPTSTPYAVCVRQCVGSVCVTPCACFAGSPHTASSATPWAALRGDIKGQALAWHSPCTHTHMLTHMEWPGLWPVVHSPMPSPP